MICFFPFIHLGATTTSNKTFVFDLKNKIKYSIKDGGKNAICSSNIYGPCFGNKGLWVNLVGTSDPWSGRYENQHRFISTSMTSVFNGSPFTSQNTKTYIIEVFYET